MNFIKHNLSNLIKIILLVMKKMKKIIKLIIKLIMIIKIIIIKNNKKKNIKLIINNLKAKITLTNIKKKLDKKFLLHFFFLIKNIFL